MVFLAGLLATVLNNSVLNTDFLILILNIGGEH